MRIRQANLQDFDTIREITVQTIHEIYPHYYPKGAVAFFLEHHNDDNIVKDIQHNQVFLCFDSEQNAVGTVTIKQNEICRLFVLPQYQGNGFGRELLDFTERMISEKYDEIQLDASFPAKAIYLKRGYSVIESNVIRAKQDDFLCYDVMGKKV